MSDRQPIRRALVSVFDKTGLVDLARALSEASTLIPLSVLPICGFTNRSPRPAGGEPNSESGVGGCTSTGLGGSVAHVVREWSSISSESEHCPLSPPPIQYGPRWGRWTEWRVFSVKREAWSMMSKQQ